MTNDVPETTQRRSVPKPCYICEAPSTGVDHVPARAFFPKDRRLQLVAVPACDTHNGECSKDDEVLSTLLAAHYLTNDVGISHFENTRLRAIKARPGLAAATFSSVLNVVQTADGTETGVFRFDASRIDPVVARYARGLYYARFRHPWRRELRIDSDGLITDVDEAGVTLPAAAAVIESVKKRFDQANLPRYGANPRVVWWEWLDVAQDDDSKTVLRLCFYEGMTFFATPMPTEDERNGRPLRDIRR